MNYVFYQIAFKFKIRIENLPTLNQELRCLSKKQMLFFNWFVIKIVQNSVKIFDC